MPEGSLPPSDLVGRLYDAAAEPTLWPEVLAALAREVKAQGAVLYMVDAALGMATFWCSARATKAAMERIQGQFPPLTFLTRACNETCADTLLMRERFMADADYEASPLYREVLGGADIWHVMGETVHRDRSTLAVVGFHRPRSAPPFSTDDIDGWRTLAPHVHRAVRLQRRIAVLELQRNDAAETLDRLPLGVILVSRRGRVITMNRCAKDIVARNDGLRIDKSGFCRADAPAEKSRLAALISSAAERGGDTATKRGGAMRLSRPSQRRPLSVLVQPLSGPGAGQRGAAILYVRDPDLPPGTSAAVLADTYGLTAAEAKLLQALIQGKRMEDAAGEFGVSVNTLRTQLQNIFRKTETTRQSELLSLVLTGSAPMAARSGKEN